MFFYFFFFFRKNSSHELENGIEWERANMPLKNWQPVKLDYKFSICRSSHFDHNQIDIRFSLLFSYSYLLLLLERHVKAIWFECVGVCVGVRTSASTFMIVI